MFEHQSQPLLSKQRFIKRILHSVAMVQILVAASLCVGTVGYRLTEGLGWVDAFYNAALILSGMGPASELHSNAAKIFASLYSLYSGLLLIAVSGFLLAPVFHRMLHKFHVGR